MAREVRDDKGNLVGINARHMGDLQVEHDYRSPGGLMRRVLDTLGGVKPEPPVVRPEPEEHPLKDRPINVHQVDLARPSSFKDGGTVEKTGWAKVHKGETIMSAGDLLGAPKAPKAEKAEKAPKAKKAKSKKGGKKPHRIHVRGAANGGYIAEHEFPPSKPGEIPAQNEEHQLASLDDLKEHIGEHAAEMGGNGEEEAEGPEQAA